ncbi:MAG: peptide chain release factor 1 [Saprospiraceae bacterium]
MEQLLQQLEGFVHRYQDLELQMSDPDVISDPVRFTRINKAYKSLEPVVLKYKEYVELLGNLSTARSMLKETDPEMREMAQEEILSLEPMQRRLEEEIRILLIPKDPEDEKDVIVEIRAGTGGDEASIFAGDLFRMYSRYFDTQGWKHEVMSQNEGSAGGYKEIVMEVKGTDVYAQLKFESGAHRVQRVPKTESQGRIHTSAATVAVIPVFEFEDVDILKSDLKTDTFRASGAGGQHVNKTESGVRFTHLPTGIVAESTEARSQIKNREIAMQRLIQKIQDTRRAEHDSAMASQRKSLVGTGDRSDKIRTYNYPQNRVTDHRINLTLYNLDQIMEGQIGDIIQALQTAENASKLEAQANH